MSRQGRSTRDQPLVATRVFVTTSCDLSGPLVGHEVTTLKATLFEHLDLRTVASMCVQRRALLLYFPTTFGATAMSLLTAAQTLCVDCGSGDGPSSGMLGGVAGGVSRSRLEERFMPKRKFCAACYDAVQLTRCCEADARESRKSTTTSATCSKRKKTYTPTITSLCSASNANHQLIIAPEIAKMSATINSMNMYMVSTTPVSPQHRFVHLSVSQTYSGTSNKQLAARWQKSSAA